MNHYISLSYVENPVSVYLLLLLMISSIKMSKVYDTSRCPFHEMFICKATVIVLMDSL